jgi:hypothetical protein
MAIGGLLKFYSIEGLLKFPDTELVP